MNKYICFNKNEDYVYEIENILCDKKQKILDFFETSDNGTFDFKIYIYNNLNEMHEALRKKNIITNNIVYYLDKNNSIYLIEPDDCFKEKYKHKIFNEEIRGIEHLIYGKHPKWLSDGIVFYINNVDLKTIIENENINEYEEPYSSYIVVSYLIEQYTKTLFIRLICLQSFIDLVEGSNILDKAIIYYKNIYKKTKIKEKS